MNILVTGGTGLAGAEIIRQAINDSRIKKNSSNCKEANGNRRS